jgi:uncharacterized protein
MPDDKAWIAGDFMQTFSGGRYYPLNPTPDQINSVDIAHALSNLCRYGGHVDRFYSVAEHCVLLSRSVAPENALHALLHDATEAYVVDVPRPVKQHLANYKDLEHRVWIAICQKFGISNVVPAEVTDHDNRILLNERKALMHNAEVGAWTVDGLEPLDTSIFAWSPNRAEIEYMDRLAELLEARLRVAL